jgi:hypothetical protein
MSREAYEHQEQAFERKFISQQEREFHVVARRDKLFGQWLAGLLGYSGEAAHAYVRAVVASNLEKPGDDDILAKVRADLDAAKVDAGDLVKKLGEFRIAASFQIDSEGKV